MYDVVNILETIGLLKLKVLPKQKVFHLSLDHLFETVRAIASEASDAAIVVRSSAVVSTPSYTSSNLTVLFDAADSTPPTDGNWTSSLSGLTRHFTRLVVGIGADSVTLDEITSAMPCPAPTHVRRISRRLCDIANVLVAAGVVEKCVRPGIKRKSAYRWVGDGLTIDRLLVAIDDLDDPDVPGHPDPEPIAPKRGELCRITFGTSLLMDRTLFHRPA